MDEAEHEVWCPQLGVERSQAVKVNGKFHRQAACRWARRFDEESKSKSIAEHGAIVMVSFNGWERAILVKGQIETHYYGEEQN